MKVCNFVYLSFQSHTPSTEQLNQSILMMITNVDSSMKKEWVNKLKPTH